MEPVRLAVIFYSSYGTNFEMARIAAQAAQDAGAEVRLRRVRETAPPEVVQSVPAWAAQLEAMKDIPEVGHEDLVWADAYLFSCPTRYGVAASQMRAFIDTLGPLWMEGKLVNKCVSAMTSSQNPHGGQETTLLSLYTTFMHWGAILVPPGYTDASIFAAGGNPYGTSAVAGQVTDEVRAAVRHQTRRLIDIAGRLKAGSAAVAGSAA